MAVRVKQAEVTESFQLIAVDTYVTVGDILEWMVPDTIGGKEVKSAAFGAFTAGVGNSTYQVRKKKLSDDSEVDLLITVATIEDAERHTSQATTPPVIDSSEDLLATGDILIFECESIGTTAPKGLFFAMSCR